MVGGGGRARWRPGAWLRLGDCFFVTRTAHGIKDCIA